MKKGTKELGAYIVMNEEDMPLTFSGQYSHQKDAEAAALCCVRDSIRDNNLPDVWYVLKVVKKTVLKKSAKLVDVVTLDDLYRE